MAGRFGSRDPEDEMFRQATLVALACLMIAACGGARPIVSAETAPPTTVMFDVQQEPAAVRGAIARALGDRGYRVENEEGARVVAALDHRNASLRVAIDYGSDRATIQYIDSDGVEQRQYEGWMRNLEQSIRHQVASPPTPEPAAAAVVAPVERGPEPMAVIVEPARDVGAVRGAVARALVARGYVVEGEEGQRIAARYTRGGDFLRISVEYAGERAVISYVESQNVELAQYEGWMRGLQSTVQDELSRTGQ
jgi:hypothetical protein